jgi:hypothetical protein
LPNVPDYLVDLTRRAQAAVDAVEQAQGEPRDILVARVERTRTDAERMADALAYGVIAAEQEAIIRWSRIQADWKDHVLSMRAHIRDQFAMHDTDTLAKRAQYAETYAQATAALAAAAIQEAEYAVLDATLARADAQQGSDHTPPGHDTPTEQGGSAP